MNKKFALSLSIFAIFLATALSLVKGPILLAVVVLVLAALGFFVFGCYSRASDSFSRLSLEFAIAFFTGVFIGLNYTSDRHLMYFVPLWFVIGLCSIFFLFGVATEFLQGVDQEREESELG